MIRIAPRLAEARVRFAMALVRLNRHDAAREQLTQAIEDNPDDPRIAQALARLAAARSDARPRP